MSNSQVIIHLKKVLADSSTLYLKTQNYHWNVTGPYFKNLHEMFEDQYRDLAEAIDTTAELIRALGEKAPGTWKAYAAITCIQDGDENTNAQTMIQNLSQDQEIITQTLNEALSSAHDAGEEIVADFLISRMTVHKKNKWMLDSSC